MWIVMSATKKRLQHTGHHENVVITQENKEPHLQNIFLKISILGLLL